MKIKYKDIKLRGDSLTIVRQANEIIDEYQARGFTLTLRQTYYQFVSRGLLGNTDKNYKRLGSILNDARLAGLVDWEAMEDRTRYLRKLPHWVDPQSIVRSCAEQFRLDKWRNQRYYCEVAIEKDALLGVIEGVCNELEVPYLACRGYSSASEVWRAGHDRFLPQLQAGKACVLLYLGDLDPSGWDMPRDLQARLDLFTGSAGNVEVRRLALNSSQVEQYQPPPNPAKLTDSRSGPFIEQFGEDSYELDALDPTVIADLIRGAALSLRDEDLWAEDVASEEESKRHLAGIAANWASVIRRLPRRRTDD